MPSPALPSAEPRAWPRRLATAALLLAFAGAFALALAAGDGGWQPWLIEQLRLPRALAAAGVGALLAQAGMNMQVLLRNPLADPYVLGASGGAGLGAVLALLLGASLWLGSVLGAAAVLALLLLLGARWLASRGDEAPAQLILTGAMLAAIAAAASLLLLSLVPDQQLRGVVFWLAGDLSGATHGPALLALVALLAGWTLWRARRLDRLLLGSEAAWLLGEPVARLRLELVLTAALATGAAVAVAGTIGFVGLVVPQALRLLGWQRARALAWGGPLGGATLLLLADTVSRTVALPYELPVGAVTALVGAPAFIVLLRKGRV